MKKGSFVGLSKECEKEKEKTEGIELSRTTRQTPEKKPKMKNWKG